VLSLHVAFTVGLVGLLLGVAIGSTSIGGVLLVPFLIYAVGLPIHVAIAVALWSYLWSGLVAVLLYARRGSISWIMAAWLCLAALPGAYVGAKTATVVSATVLQGLIAAVLVTAGIHATFERHTAARNPNVLGRGVLLVLGGLTGFASALVGGGGAFILVPLLVVLEQPVLLAVGLGQVIQIPISVVASVANFRAGLVDVPLGTLLAVALSVGIGVGTPLAHALPQRALRRVLGWTMIIGAVAIGVRVILGAGAAGQVVVRSNSPQLLEWQRRPESVSVSSSCVSSM
jgi:uncharacterized protein